MKSVGIIVNPAAGKDLRRLVAYGSNSTHSEKINAVVRMLRVLDALGVERVCIAPDPSKLGERAIETAADGLQSIDAGILEMPQVDGRAVRVVAKSPLARAQKFEEIERIRGFAGDVITGRTNPTGHNQDITSR